MKTSSVQRLPSDLEGVLAAIDQPASVSAACRELELFLSRNREHARSFFRSVFPVLLRKLFGFEDSLLSTSAAFSAVATSAGGWFAAASRPGSEADAKALVALLSPTSTLFQLMLAVDREGSVRFLFPVEHLPPVVVRLLGSDAGAVLLCRASPLYSARLLQAQSGSFLVQLRVAEYFVFWFVYYAVCKDLTACSIRRNGAAKQALARGPRQLRTQLESWTTSLHWSSMGGGQRNRPYTELLSRYLAYALQPMSATASTAGSSTALSPLRQSRAASAHLHPTPPQGEGAVGAAAVCLGDVLVHAIVEWWLIGEDPLPLPASLRTSPSQLQSTVWLSSPAIAASYGYVPPTDELLDCLSTVITTLSASWQPAGVQSYPYSTTAVPSPRLPQALGSPEQLRLLSPESAGAGTGVATADKQHLASAVSSSLASGAKSHAVLLQRPLFRFLAQAFISWPLDAASVPRMRGVVDLWLAYLQPWKSHSCQLSGAARVGLMGARFMTGVAGARSAAQDGGGGVASRAFPGAKAGTFVPAWRDFVAANYLFYDALTVHFLEFSLKAVQIDPECTLQLVAMVLSVLDSSQQLQDLLRNLFAAHGVCFPVVGLPQARAATSDMLQFAPVIQQQIQEWQDGLSAETAFLSRGDQLRKASPLLRLFAPESTGGPGLVQAILARAKLATHAQGSGQLHDLLRKVSECASKTLDPKRVSEHVLDPSLEPARGSALQAALPTSQQADGQGGQRAPPGVAQEPAWRPSSQSFLWRSVTSLRPRNWGSTRRGVSQDDFREPNNIGGPSAASGLFPQDAQHASFALRKPSWTDVRYRGDWMRRPIEANEIAFLVRIMVWLSDCLNQVLGIDAQQTDEQVRPTPAERIAMQGSAGGEASEEYGGEVGRESRTMGASRTGNHAEDENVRTEPPLPPVVLSGPSEGAEAGASLLSHYLHDALMQAWPAVNSVWRSAVRGGRSVSTYARKRGWRVNLRVLAEKQTVNLTVLSILLYILGRTIISLIYLQ